MQIKVKTNIKLPETLRNCEDSGNWSKCPLDFEKMDLL